MMVTVVTGASSGIGRSLARRLAAGGDPVALFARRELLLEELAAEIEAFGGRALSVPCDVTDRDAVHAAVVRVEDIFGPVERLVANAGGGEPTDSVHFDATHLANMVALNLTGTAYCIEAVLPGMLRRKNGHLVAVSSLAAYRGLPGAGAYSASKAALTNLMESLRVDLKPHGVDVTLLLPGFVRTKTGPAKRKRNKPFRLELEDATSRMEKAIRSRRPRYAFPLVLAVLARLASWLPARLYDRAFAGHGRRATNATKQ